MLRDKHCSFLVISFPNIYANIHALNETGKIYINSFIVHSVVWLTFSFSIL